MMYLGVYVNIMMFADDCVLYKSHECCNIILESLNGLNSYVDWGETNDMHLNASKTKAMMIFPRVLRTFI